jgi:hypothetical protein
LKTLLGRGGRVFQDRGVRRQELRTCLVWIDRYVALLPEPFDELGVAYHPHLVFLFWSAVFIHAQDAGDPAADTELLS